MNDEQLDKLIAAARQNKPDTARAEYGFEIRLLARLRQERTPSWSVWAWRLMPLFAAIVVALGVWNFIAPTDDASGLEAALTGGQEAQLLITRLGGN